MQFLDFRINDHVRRILTQHWIDTSKLDYGTTNCVVYIRGVIRQTKSSLDPARDHEDRLRLINVLETEIKRVQGVTGIVMKLDGFIKDGGTWKYKAHG